ncbi:hypothetical protein QZH41_009996 [Actinostola sp. cb2023]|nr:hypothetical protein QZH41_009996 [Actinostola sp. cb2023]
MSLFRCQLTRRDSMLLPQASSINYREEVNESVRKLQQSPLQNLEKVYEHIYHRHNSGQKLEYTLSEDAFRFFLQKEKELVDLQNSIFSGCSEGVAQNISKAPKLVLRLSVALHVLINQLSRALCGVQYGEIPTVIEKDTMKGAIHLANWFMDHRNILEKNSDDSHSNPDQFGIAKRIIETPGPFVTIRMACRLAHCTSSSAVAAMEKLSKEKVGILDDNMKCFFKYAPLTVCEDSLELYGVDIVR